MIDRKRSSDGNIIRVHPDFKRLLDRLAQEQKTNKVEVSRVIARKVDYVDFHYKRLTNNGKKCFDNIMGGGVF
jgi:hypothetical protein